MSDTKITFDPAAIAHEDLAAFEHCLQLQVELGKGLRGWFKELPLAEAAYYALTRDTSFLGDDPYYCGHIYYTSTDEEGEEGDKVEVSLYDDMYWERHETRYLRDLLDSAFDDWCWGKQEKFSKKGADDHLNLLAEWCSQFPEEQTPRAAVCRDLIKSGTGCATFDW